MTIKIIDHNELVINNNKNNTNNNNNIFMSYILDD